MNATRNRKAGETETNPFEELAERYDAWFDSPRGRSIFSAETRMLCDLLEEMPRPWLEVGVGTGRFAQALGVEEGIDPSARMLAIADRRNIKTREGCGENLPFDNSTYGAVLMVVTICFLANPSQAFREAERVLRGKGCLIVGLVPEDSSWGCLYAAKAKEGHSFYSSATFYSCGDVIQMANAAGFAIERSKSCLFESPEAEVDEYSASREGIIPDAGFVGMRFKKAT